jgi:hypothetical protein
MQQIFQKIGIVGAGDRAAIAQIAAQAGKCLPLMCRQKQQLGRGKRCIFNGTDI